MKLKIGDEVSFLNENGGGKVIKIIDSRMVMIETKDGFEMPVLASDLIPDMRAAGRNKASELIEVPVRRKTEVESPIQEVEEEDDIRTSEINPWGNIKEEKGIYLGFEPHEPQWVLTGKLDVVLINNTSYEILYSLFMEVNKTFEGIDFGSVPADSKIVIDSIERDDLQEWTKGYVQVLFHHDLPEKILFPLHANIDISVNRFFKEGSYKSNTLLDNRALLVSIAPLASIEAVKGTEKESKFGFKTSSSDSITLKEKPMIDKYRVSVGEAIVDLHIGEIVDNILGMKSSDMLQTQIEFFKKALNSAITAEYSKVTFIHGVGNGVLKNAIIKELDNYENTENQMASISKFGVGAIDIKIDYTDQ